MTPIPETVPPIEVRMAEIVFPNHTNHLGTLFGGRHWRGWTRPPSGCCPLLAPHRGDRAQRPVDFKLPIRIGQMVKPSAALSKSAAAR